MKWVAVILALAVTGCGYAFPRPELQVQNLDGPPVSIVINGKTIARLVCQFEEGESNLTLDPSDPALPSMPWSLSLIHDDGAEHGSWNIEGLESAQELIVREEGAALKSPGPVGPAPNSNPGCPDAGLRG